MHAVIDGTVVTKGIVLIKDDLSFNANAELHAITATAQPYIIQRQKSFADPQGIFE